MPICTVIVRFQAKPGQGPALAAALGQAVQHTITLPDCFKVVLKVNQADSDAMVIYEEWRTAEAYKAYEAAVMADPKMGPVMEMMAGPPNAEYFDDHSHGGGAWGGPGHLEISTNDLAATKAFLTEVFNWQIDAWMDNYEGFLAPGGFMGGLRPKMPEEPAPQTVPYLIVDDLEARMAAVEAAGGTIVVPIQTVPNAGRFFWFLAPGGVQLAVWESTNP